MQIAIVYWSGTGNTEAMAQAVAEGARSRGAQVELLPCAAFDAGMVSGFDAIGFGCPAMGAEVLEETEFDPMFSACLPELSGKRVAPVSYTHLSSVPAGHFRYPAERNWSPAPRQRCRCWSR